MGKLRDELARAIQSAEHPTANLKGVALAYYVYADAALAVFRAHLADEDVVKVLSQAIRAGVTMNHENRVKSVEATTFEIANVHEQAIANDLEDRVLAALTSVIEEG